MPFSIGPVDIKGTENVISSLQENKVGLPIKILKTSKKQLSVPLTYLINLALETGISPETLKTANVIPIAEIPELNSTKNKSKRDKLSERVLLLT